MLEIYKDKIHKSRKEHKCQFCNEKIEVGEKNHRQSGKYDGYFFDRCLHMRCDNIISEYCKEEHEWTDISYDWVKDWLANKFCYDCSEWEDCIKEAARCERLEGYFNKECG